MRNREKEIQRETSAKEILLTVSTILVVTCQQPHLLGYFLQTPVITPLLFLPAIALIRRPLLLLLHVYYMTVPLSRLSPLLLLVHHHHLFLYPKEILIVFPLNLLFLEIHHLSVLLLLLVLDLRGNCIWSIGLVLLRFLLVFFPLAFRVMDMDVEEQAGLTLLCLHVVGEPPYHRVLAFLPTLGELQGLRLLLAHIPSMVDGAPRGEKDTKVLEEEEEKEVGVNVEQDLSLRFQEDNMPIAHHRDLPLVVDGFLLETAVLNSLPSCLLIHRHGVIIIVTIVPIGTILLTTVGLNHVLLLLLLPLRVPVLLLVVLSALGSYLHLYLQVVEMT